MIPAMISSHTYYMGWDAGGWNCDKNFKSRDAIVILNDDNEQVGKPFRGNLSKTISASQLFGGIIDIIV